MDRYYVVAVYQGAPREVVGTYGSRDDANYYAQYHRLYTEMPYTYAYVVDMFNEVSDECWDSDGSRW